MSNVRSIVRVETYRGFAFFSEGGEGRVSLYFSAPDGDRPGGPHPQCGCGDDIPADRLGRKMAQLRKYVDRQWKLLAQKNKRNGLLVDLDGLPWWGEVQNGIKHVQYTGGDTVKSHGKTEYIWRAYQAVPLKAVSGIRGHTGFPLVIRRAGSFSCDGWPNWMPDLKAGFEQRLAGCSSWTDVERLIAYYAGASTVKPNGVQSYALHRAVASYMEMIPIERLKVGR